MTCVCGHDEKLHWMSHEGTTVCNGFGCFCPNYERKDLLSEDKK